MSREKIKDVVLRTLGGRLKYAIKAKGLTSKAFARMLGTTAVTISNYIRGQHAPSAPVIAQMAFLLDVPKTWLLFGDRLGMDRPLAGVAEGAGEAYRDSLPGELRAAWQDLDAEERAALLRNAATLWKGDRLSREALIAQSKILGKETVKRPRREKGQPGDPSRRGLVG